LTVCGKSKFKKPPQYIVEKIDRIYYNLYFIENFFSVFKTLLKIPYGEKMKRKRTPLKIDALGFTLIELMVVIS